MVHYENSDEDSEESDEYYDEKYNNNESNSENNESKSEDSKNYKKNKSLKIYNRDNKKGLKGFHIFSKETILPDNYNKNNSKNKNKKYLKIFII